MGLLIELDFNKSNMRNALIITENAKDNTFVNCEINGSTMLAGKNNKFTNTVFRSLSKQPKGLIVLEVLAAILTIVSGILAVL